MNLKRGTAVAVIVFLLTVGIVTGAQAQPPTATVPTLARTLPDVESVMLQAFQVANLTDHLIWIAADTNGHLTIGWVVLTFPGDQPDPIAFLQRRVWDLLREAFTAVPSLDEIHVTGLPSGLDPFGLHRHRVVFSAAVSRAEFLELVGNGGSEHPFTRFPRMWIQPAMLYHEHTRPREGSPGLVGPSRAAPAEDSMRFRGDPAAQARELQHHIAGLTYGGIIEGKLYHGDPSRPVAALTFDDGPFPIYTTLLLDTLASLHVKATFFLVGEQVRQYPYFAQAIVQAGHEVANHSFHHPNLTLLPPSAVDDELRRTQEIITAVTGQTPQYFRPPGGEYNETVLHAARALGLITVLWTDNPADYANPAPRVFEARTLEQLSNGGILLLHMGVGVTIRGLPDVVNNLHRRGISFETVSGLLAVPKPVHRRR